MNVSSDSENNDISPISEVDFQDNYVDESDLDRQLEELNEDDSEDEASFMSIDELMEYVGNFLDESIDGVIPYKYLPTSQRKYEPLLGFKPMELKGRLDNEPNEENDKLFKYRKSAVHQAYKKVRNETKKFVERNFQKLAVAETPGKIPPVVYADAADHIANKNPNIFYVRGDTSCYRYEFNFVLCWLIQDLLGREIRRSNNNNKKDHMMKSRKQKILGKKKRLLEEKQRREILKTKSRTEQGPSIKTNMDKVLLRLQGNKPTLNNNRKHTPTTDPVRKSSSKHHMKNNIATEPVRKKEKYRKSATNKENNETDFEEKIIFSSSAPSTSNNTGVEDKKRKTRGKKIDYRRANDRGLVSHASFKL